MNKFKVGDRVKVYDGGYGYSGTVDAIEANSSRVRISCRVSWIHPKQCRRLKPRPKPREIWIREADIPKPLRSGNAVVSSAELVGDAYLLFREVKKV